MLGWINRRVNRKIVAGYLVMAALILAMGIASLQMVGTASWRIHERSDQLMRTLAVSRDIGTQVALLRVHADAYISSGRQSDLNQFIDHFDDLQQFLGDFRQLVDQPERLESLRQMDQTTQAYGKLFEEVVELIRRRQDLVHTRMQESSYQVENHLSALKLALGSSGDMSSYLLFDKVQVAFGEMVVNASRYLQDGDERFAVLFKRAHRESAQTFVALARRLTSRPELDNLRAAQRAMDSYAVVFDRLHLDFVTVSRLRRDGLPPLENRIMQGVVQVAAELEKEVRGEREESSRILANTRRRLLLFTGLVLLGGLAFGVFIARRITRPLHAVMKTSKQIADQDLRSLIGQLDRLSGGDPNVEFEVTAAPLHRRLTDEVGEMARAFDTIVEQLLAARDAFAAMTAYLQRMADATAGVAAGRLDLDLAVAGPNDVLGSSIRNMIANLRRARQEVESYREHLEDQVAARTRELEESRRSLVTLMGNLQGMAYRCRNVPEWTMEFVSDGVLALTGYDPEEILDNRTVSYGSLIHPEERNKVWESVQSALAERRPFVVLYRIHTKQDEEKWVWEKGRGVFGDDGELLALEGFITDISDRKRMEVEREELIAQLREALAKVKTLSGLLPICSSCKRIRDDQGYWQQIESYIHDHSEADFSHSICPECMKKLYPDFDL